MALEPKYFVAAKTTNYVKFHSLNVRPPLRLALSDNLASRFEINLGIWRRVKVYRGKHALG